MASHGVARTAQARTHDQRLQELEKIKTYRNIDLQIRIQAAQQEYDLELFQLTTKLLRLNPEYYTVWNIRRRCLLTTLLSGEGMRAGSDDQSRVAEAKDQDSVVRTLQSELDFTVPLLMEFPKCYWIWNFRRWILSRANLDLRIHAARQIWETELGLVSKMLTKDQRNFHAWGYRRIVVAQLESSVLQGRSMVEDEFTYTTKMIRLNLSNFSAWHNRSQLMPRLLDERGADDETRAAFLADELKIVREGLNLSPEDQSLWYYHRFLVSQIVGIASAQPLTPNLSMDERVAYLGHEIDEIRDLLEDYDDIKWIYEALVEYTEALELLRQQCTKCDGGGSREVKSWLTKLRTLDPMRAGRWNDAEKRTCDEDDESGTGGLEAEAD